ncbi:MAG: DUF192 domain-containing protein [Vulcanimicrobiaceae bacterium]
MTVRGSLIDAASGRTVAARIVRADTLFARTAGLLGRSRLNDDEGMVFANCGAVHTMGMRMPIDVLFLDGDGVVVHVEPCARPWRAYVGAPGAHTVVELAGGACERRGIVPKQRLELRWDSST